MKFYSEIRGNFIGPPSLEVASKLNPLQRNLADHSQVCTPAAAKKGMVITSPFKFAFVLQFAMILAPGCCISFPAHADSAVGYHLGTFGVGLDYNRRLRNTATVRLGYNFYVMGRNENSNGVQYDAKLKITTASLLVDLHHADSSWRLTLGLSESGPRIEAKGNATGTVTFNGQTYNADELGNLNVKIKPKNAVAPYMGIGYGQAVGVADRFTFLADLGVLYVGAPTSKVNAECGSSVTSTECDQLMSDIRAEAAVREEDWKKLKWWPVLSIGFAMRW